MSFPNTLNDLKLLPFIPLDDQKLLPFIPLGSMAAPKLLSAAGLETGLPAVQYYSEIHTSQINSLIHTFGMPFVAYGSLLIVPVLWNGTVRSYVFVQKAVYITFMSHYVAIDPRVGIVASLVYLAPTHFAIQETKQVCKDVDEDGLCSPRSASEREFMRIALACKGLLMMGAALVAQEFFGHYLCGDAASRPEGVLNAMLYAKYYSISHWLN